MFQILPTNYKYFFPFLGNFTKAREKTMLNFLSFCAMTYFLKYFNVEIDFSSQN